MKKEFFFLLVLLTLIFSMVLVGCSGMGESLKIQVVSITEDDLGTDISVKFNNSYTNHISFGWVHDDTVQIVTDSGTYTKELSVTKIPSGISRMTLSIPKPATIKKITIKQLQLLDGRGLPSSGLKEDDIVIYDIQKDIDSCQVNFYSLRNVLSNPRLYLTLVGFLCAGAVLTTIIIHLRKNKKSIQPHRVDPTQFSSQKNIASQEAWERRGFTPPPEK